MSLTKQENRFELICKNLLSGGIAGMVSKSTVAPLDRIKILLQAHNKHHDRHGVLSGFRHVIKKEGALALYKGNGAQMVRIFPYAATQFTSFEIYKKYLDGIFGETSHIDKFIAGAGAGLTSVALTYPLDTIRARLAFQVTGEHVYTGIVHAASTIFKTEGGTRALYRGFLPTLMGMVPYAGMSFYCFEYLKYGCMKYLPKLTCNPCDNNTGGLVLAVPAKLLCGGLAGAIAQSISYPLDVTRRRMQLAMMNPSTHHFGKSMFFTLYRIYTDHGIIKGLYRGMSINYIRATPMVAVSFSTYEVCKQLLHLDTGLKVVTGKLSLILENLSIEGDSVKRNLSPLFPLSREYSIVIGLDMLLMTREALHIGEKWVPFGIKIVTNIIAFYLIRNNSNCTMSCCCCMQ